MAKTIEIPNVPDALCRRLESLAALEGKSLSDFLLTQLGRVAELPTREEMRQRLARLSPTDPSISPEEAVRAERDAE